MLNLRPYQRQCRDAVFERFARYDSALVVMATGLGKTVVGGSIIESWPAGERILWLAHREELIEQARDSIARITGEMPAVEMAERFSDEHGFEKARVVVSSVQTMSRPRRRRRFRPTEFGLIVTDEAHHAVAKSYREIVKYFRHGERWTAGGDERTVLGNPGIKHLGVTATPRRADDLAMGQVYQIVAYEYGIERAIDDGWLVPVQQQIVIVEGIEFKRIKTVAGDFQQDQLELMMSNPPLVDKIATSALDAAGERQGLVFCVGVEQAKLLAAVLNGYRPGCADVVTGTTDGEVRKRIVRQFKAGERQLLCNCGVFLEGFDAPAASVVVMARPTRSLSLYVQMLGRATRPLAGTVEGLGSSAERKAAIAASRKPLATVLDFVGNAEAHGATATVNAVDALGGRYGADVRQYAKRTLGEEKGGASIDEAMERAEAELDLLREEEERRRTIEAKARYHLREIGDGPRRHAAAESSREPATSRQVWKLRSLGMSYTAAKALTKREAGRKIGELATKQNAA